VSTMRQVAAAAGVSAKTVSRVINNDRYVSQHVRDRVEHAVAELQYVPNVLARTFRAGTDRAIGLAVPDLTDPFFAAITKSVAEVASARDTAVVVCNLGNDGARERAGVEALLGRRLIGLIATPVSADQSYLAPWLERTATVFIDRPPSRLTADAVLEDDFGGARLATEHLLRHGHRRIGFLGDDLGLPTTARRLEGYRAALDGAASADLVVLGGAGAGDAARITEHVLAGRKPATALFCSNARLSQDVVPALQELGRRDVALVSYGDFPLAAALQPALTVIDQDPATLGRLAAERLFSRPEHPQRRLRRRIVLPVALIRRASCGMAPARRGTTAQPGPCRVD
jgi:LacI family transcriptional regulator